MSGLFGGGSSKLSQFKPVGISAGGLNASFDKGRNRIIVSSINPRVSQLDERIAQLRKQLLPIATSGRGQFIDKGRGGGFFEQVTMPVPESERQRILAEIAQLEQERQQALGEVTPREAALGQTTDLFNRQADEIGALRSQVTPGFGRLTQAQDSIFNEARARIRDAERRAVGTLRDNLSRRRVLGSSFADDVVARTQREFAIAENEITNKQSEARAQSFLQELELNNRLLNQQFQAARSAVQVTLDELNLEASIATQLATNATTNLGENARLQAQLDAQAAAGAGAFFGSLITLGANKILTPAPTK